MDHDFASNGQAFAVIAGFRLDTTAWNRLSDREVPRWPTTVLPPADLSRAIRKGFSVPKQDNRSS